MSKVTSLAVVTVLVLGCGRRNYDGGDAGQIDAAQPDAQEDAQGPEPVPVGAVQVFYGQGPNAPLRSQTLIDGQWSAPEQLPIGATQNRWVRALQSKPAGLTVASSLSDTGAGSQFSVATKLDAESGWLDGFSTDAVAANGTLVRGADIAVESQSGDLLAVYTTNDATPRYRTFSQGTWSGELVVPVNGNEGGPFLNSNDATWVELVARPRFDEIALLYTSDNDLLVIVWRDDAWQQPTAINMSADLVLFGESITRWHPFVGAYEDQSGELFVAWGEEPNSSELHHRTLPANGSQWTPQLTLGIGSVDALGLRGVPQLGGNAIMVSAADFFGNTRFGVGRWNGAVVEAFDEIITPIRPQSAATIGDFGTAVAWTSAGAVGVYAGVNPGFIDYALFDGAIWTLQTSVAVPGMGAAESIELLTLADGSILALFNDDAAKLWAAIFDGVNWTVSNGGQPLEADISATDAVSFSAFVRE
jgi:hypothetical protein